MNKRALVIGSQVHQLRGVEHDVGDVRDTLARRGFELDVRLGGRAGDARRHPRGLSAAHRAERTRGCRAGLLLGPRLPQPARRRGPAAPAGHRAHRLRRGDDFVLGRDELGGQLVGQKLLWPHGVASGGQARLDELVVIVTTQPSDLRHLETGAAPRPPEWAGSPASRGGGRSSQLTERLAQLRDGTPRSVAKPERERDDYFVKRLSFFLEPPPPRLGNRSATTPTSASP